MKKSGGMRENSGDKVQDLCIARSGLGNDDAGHFYIFLKTVGRIIIVKSKNVFRSRLIPPWISLSLLCCS